LLQERRRKMFTQKKFILSFSFAFLLFWMAPAFGLVINGPDLNMAEKGWRDFGLLIRAEADVTLVSVRFPNQGLADVIELRRNSDSALLASFPVPAGNGNVVVNINYPLVAQEVYRLVATTPNNKHFGNPGVFAFPAGNPDITVLGSYLGFPYYSYWFSFNEIVTEPNILELEAAIDIKPGSDVNSINLKSKGVVPVAILTTEGFDAPTVDSESVMFAGAYAVRWRIEDVDGDGDDDVLFHFKTEDLTELSSDSTEAVLTGATLEGIPFFGVDGVNIVPRK
jgi:hypothetical protein